MYELYVIHNCFFFNLVIFAECILQEKFSYGKIVKTLSCKPNAIRISFLVIQTHPKGFGSSN